MPRGGRLAIETNNTLVDDSPASHRAGLTMGTYVMISVTDTGVGMPQDIIDRVFEPFFTTKPIGQGTGLGLSMVYGFTKQSRGHVLIESQLGVGTKDQIIPAALAADRRGRSRQNGVGEVERAAAGEIVLVVEDDPAVRLLVTEVLTDLGYRTLEAGSGETALPILQSKQKIDLLVSDVGLPGLNGRQIAEIARQSRPQLKVLFITGYAENAAIRGDFLAPGMDLITKPFALELLASKVSEMIGTTAG